MMKQSNKNLVKLGSKTAKNGFKNEQDVCNKFNSWASDVDAQQWLLLMGYKIEDIEYVKAKRLHGYKTDVNVQIQIKTKQAVDTENIQVKLVSNKTGFNQVDKRWLEKYKEMWNMPDNVFNLLKFYTGENKPYKPNTKDSRRMFMNEFASNEQQDIVNWFKQNKMLILTDIIKGRGIFSVEWVLVAQKIAKNAKWVLVNINPVLQHYSIGDVCISPRGSLYIGKVTMQRKGGDGGRKTANMLQFKLDPTELFDIEQNNNTNETEDNV